METQFQFKCATTDDTKALAEVIGKVLRGGELLEFTSDLGGGKTTFVKGLGVGMGVTDVIQSPTFTISQLHKAAHDRELHHYDFYRLHDPGVVKAALVESLEQPNAVVAIEWGDAVHDVLPADRITVKLQTPLDDETRVVSIACSPKFEHVLRALQTYKETRNMA